MSKYHMIEQKIAAAKAKKLKKEALQKEIEQLTDDLAQPIRSALLQLEKHKNPIVVRALRKKSHDEKMDREVRVKNYAEKIAWKIATDLRKSGEIQDLEVPLAEFYYRSSLDEGLDDSGCVEEITAYIQDFMKSYLLSQEDFDGIQVSHSRSFEKMDDSRYPDWHPDWQEHIVLHFSLKLK